MNHYYAQVEREIVTFVDRCEGKHAKARNRSALHLQITVHQPYRFPVSHSLSLHPLTHLYSARMKNIEGLSSE